MHIGGSIGHAGRDEATPRADLLVSEIAARQYGVVTTEQLQECGLSRQAIGYRVQAGRLHPLYRGIYAVGHANPPRETWLFGAVKACGSGAVLCMRSAGATLEIVEWEDRCPDVLVGSLIAILHGPGPTRGRRKLARILATGAAPTQSELEDAVLDLVLRGGFAHPSVNEPLFLQGRRIVPDLRWPRQRLVIEADGPHHDDPLERAADKERQAILEAHGDRVIRVTWGQAIAHPQATLRRVADAGAPRGVS